MKMMLLSIVAVTLTSSLFAGEIPDCWSNPKHFIEGQYLLTVDAKKLKAVDILIVLEKAERGSKYYKTADFPLAFSKSEKMYVLLRSKMEEEKDKKKLQKLVEQDLVAISELAGVTIDCNLKAQLFKP